MNGEETCLISVVMFVGIGVSVYTTTGFTGPLCLLYGLTVIV